MNEIAPIKHLPVAELEREMLKLPQASCPVTHHFVAGCYIREVILPADCYAIGHRHKQPHLNLMLEGRACLVGPDGRSLEVSAPQMFIGMPGRKVGYIRERVRWLNIWPTTLTDVEELEGVLFEKSVAFHKAARLTLPEYQAAQLIGYDREDYEAWVMEMGGSQQALEERFRNVNDLISFPDGSYKVKVARSRIHGRGLIATADIKPGETICPAKIGEFRTPAGRFTNHARDPNARMLRVGDGINLIATKAIKGAQGGFDGEEVTVNYRQAIEEARQ